MKRVPQVNVLISTYNGEKYIKEQLDSVIEQSYDNIKIYIRDDGSTDSTIDVIAPYLNADKVQLIKAENVGFGRSFLSLLKAAEDGDYWAFCDQDDIWLQDKIKWAVEFMEKQNKDEPIMYHSSYYLSDEKLGNREEVKLWNERYSFSKALTEVIHMGFSTVINRPLRDLMLKADINRITSHDHWGELLAVKYGKIIEDDRISSIHRRLTESQSSFSLYARFRWLKGAWQSKSEILPVARAYCETFVANKDDDYNIAQLFVFDNYDIKKSFKKAFYPRRWRSKVSSEIVLRILMLLGKI